MSREMKKSSDGGKKALIMNSNPNEEDQDNYKNEADHEAEQQPWTFKPKKGSVIPKKRRNALQQSCFVLLRCGFSSGGASPSTLALGRLLPDGAMGGCRRFGWPLGGGAVIFFLVSRAVATAISRRLGWRVCCSSLLALFLGCDGHGGWLVAGFMGFWWCSEGREQGCGWWSDGSGQ
ncbi:hypothetical protein M0R45_010421 [Rubus argutus]|uniref:Uncharacterized protein n=1 Tax=Rubus argutus TaxID=59490 RepID=A0AAW1Y7P0_RUBAR